VDCESGVVNWLALVGVEAREIGAVRPHRGEPRVRELAG
jgi:hypothetical protein